MTGSQEATLSQEQGMGLCMVGLVDNMCHGLGEPLTVEVDVVVNACNNVGIQEIARD